MLAATIVPAMPHVLFPTPFGTCGIAWNDTGLTGFQRRHGPTGIFIFLHNAVCAEIHG